MNYDKYKFNKMRKKSYQAEYNIQFICRQRKVFV